MKKFQLAALAFCIPLFGADAPLPSAQTVIDHWINATGGRAAWEARHNVVEHATVDFAKQGIKGTLTVYEAAPDKYLGITELPGIGRISTGSNGEVAWENTSLQGPRIKQGAEQADAFREGAFNADLNWQKLYVKGEITGLESVEGHECYRLVLTPKQGNPVTEYYDKTSGLLVRTTTTVTSQLGEIPAEILYDDYQKDAGVLSAHRMVNRAAQQEFVIQIQSIETNVDLPKDRFDLPPEVQALVKKSVAAVTPDRGKLTVYMGGSPVAKENYSVQKLVNGGVDIDGSGSASLGPMKIDIEKFEVRTDAKLDPLEAIAKGTLGTIQMNVHTTFAGGEAKNEIDTGQGAQPKDIPVHTNAVVVNANLPLYPWTVLAMRASLDGRQPQQFPVYVLGQAEEQATVVFEGRDRVEFAGQTAELNHLAVTGTTPQGQPIRLDFWVDNRRKIIKMAVPSQGVEAYQDGFDPKAPVAVSEQQPPKG
ncbi:MAG TPA: hypothetical protein VME17_02930 [Bryobacteraceae bacterium]|nr:hypothetical protein [Bryobacteraceae bacterium]